MNKKLLSLFLTLIMVLSALIPSAAMSAAEAGYTAGSASLSATGYLAAPAFEVINTVGGVLIKWDRDPAVDFYRVYYLQKANTWSRIVDRVDGNHFVATGLADGNSYTYMVRGMNSNGSYATLYDTKGITVKADFATKVYRLGDADGDGSITIVDATRIQQRLADFGFSNVGVLDKRADSDGNGCDITDAACVQRYVSGLEGSRGVGIDTVDLSSYADTDVARLLPTVVPTVAPTAAPTVAPTVAPTEGRDTSSGLHTKVSVDAGKESAGVITAIALTSNLIEKENEFVNGLSRNLGSCYYYLDGSKVNKNRKEMEAEGLWIDAEIKGTKNGVATIGFTPQSEISTLRLNVVFDDGSKTGWYDISDRIGKGTVDVELPNHVVTDPVAHVSWNTVGTAPYKVELYKDGKIVKSQSTRGTSCDFDVPFSEGSKYAVKVTDSKGIVADTVNLSSQVNFVETAPERDLATVNSHMNTTSSYCNGCGMCVSGKVNAHILTPESIDRMLNHVDEAYTLDITVGDMAWNGKKAGTRTTKLTCYYWEGIETQFPTNAQPFFYSQIQCSSDPNVKLGTTNPRSLPQEYVNGEGGCQYMTWDQLIAELKASKHGQCVRTDGLHIWEYYESHPEEILNMDFFSFHSIYGDTCGCGRWHTESRTWITGVDHFTVPAEGYYERTLVVG